MGNNMNESNNAENQALSACKKELEEVLFKHGLSDKFNVAFVPKDFEIDFGEMIFPQGNEDFTLEME